VTVSGVDSVEVRVHLYERSFPAKPVSRVHVRRKQQRHRTRHARLTRRCHGSSAVLPDDSDTHPGRERPPRIEARDRVRGVAEGVAHAPDASATAADSRAHFDAGGTERRPVQRSEVAHRKEHRRINAPRTYVDPAARLEANRSPRRGNTAPKSVFPPLPGHSYASCVYWMEWSSSKPPPLQRWSLTIWRTMSIERCSCSWPAIRRRVT
jgi:hypothetical protein